MKTVVDMFAAQHGSDIEFLRVKLLKKSSKKPAPNLIQFQFVVPVIVKDFFMFTASNSHLVMNLRIFR